MGFNYYLLGKGSRGLKMKNVLIIAYSFLLWGFGVQRTVKFVKYLRSFGWEPTVLTRSLGYGDLRTIPSKDIPDGVRIVRTKAYDPTTLKVS